MNNGLRIIVGYCVSFVVILSIMFFCNVLLELEEPLRLDLGFLVFLSLGAMISLGLIKYKK